MATGKGNIHPESHSIEVMLTDGSSFMVQSSWGKEGDKMRLDVDPLTHPAWRNNQGILANANNDTLSSFNAKFDKFNGAFGKLSGSGK
jgi:large subunit ribosomal protein L31